MQAIVFNQYGSPDVLHLADVEKPTPQAGEILVRVEAAAANPLDWHFMRGAPFLVRLTEGLFKPRNNRLGADVAGVVEAVGSGVTGFQPGDAVIGEITSGAFAEYVCAAETKFAVKPSNLSFQDAAAIPVAALTALQGLRDSGGLQAGESVLINGASGGVGTFAVQIASAFGATVTGVCSTRNLERVRSIGADHVVDYTQEDFTQAGQQYDLIFDAVGNRTAGDLSRALKPDGRAVVAGFTNIPRLFHTMLVGAWVSWRSDQQIGMMPVAQMKQDDLRIISTLIEAGKVTPVIDRCYPLSQTADAIRYLETGHARGKVVITMV